MRPNRLLRALAFAILLAPPSVQPQSPQDTSAVPSVDATHSLTPVDLSGAWLAHSGDDPRFADPAFDDTHWQPILPGKRLSAYGFDKAPIVWYRTHVRIPPHTNGLALLLTQANGRDGNFWGCPQFFVNGVAIGDIKPVQPCLAMSTRPPMLPIPDSLLHADELVIAVRAGFRRPPPASFVGFYPGDSFLLGKRDDLAYRDTFYFFKDLASSASRAIMVILILLVVGAFAFSLRSDPEYRILFLFLLLDLAQNLLSATRDLSRFRTLSIAAVFPSDFAVLCGELLLIEFVRIVLRLPRSRAILAYMALLTAFWVTYDGYRYLLFEVLHSHYWPHSIVWLWTAHAIEFPVCCLLPFLALWIWRKRGNPDALLLAIPLFLKSIVEWNLDISLFGLTRGHTLRLLPSMEHIQWDEIGDIIFLLALLLFIVIRTVRLARSRALIASEIAAAGTVQQLLLARSAQPTPGFRVESVYLPASEVGGDFFLISPAPDGTLIAIVGDVSGKGMQAAMRVSAILGVLTRETSRNPAEILTNLNDALIAQAASGFTTAVCLHLTPTGQYTIANAGHINLYLAGTELQSPPALPLGLAPNQTYETLTGTLTPTQTLVLLSDGVPEARNAKGTLYGFDQLPNLTQHPAKQIATTAQQFGQEDDITVLTLSLAI